MSVDNPSNAVTILSSDGINACINLITALPGLLIDWLIWTTAAMWILFALVCPFHDWAQDKSNWVKCTANAVFRVFQIIDIAFNLLTGSIWFFELPKGSPRWYNETFSDRLRRHYRHETRGWRRHLAALFREPINVVDEGHI